MRVLWLLRAVSALASQAGCSGTGYPTGSQKNQDVWVEEHFGFDSVHLINYHFFVDLAANHPECLSNSVMLERKHGWSGLCIEANPELAKQLRAERACTVVEAPIASTSRVVSFYPAGASGGIVSKNMDNANPFSHQRVTLTARRLDEVLHTANAPRVIGYLSLDIEGAEDEALCADFPFHKYTFLLVTIERPPPSLNRRLFEHGYLFVKNHHFDTFYVHSSHPNATGISRNSTFKQVNAKCTSSRTAKHTLGPLDEPRLGFECSWS